MKNQRLKQFVMSFLIVFSLFVSSASACICSHHQETSDADSHSRHQHSQQDKAENHSHTTNAEHRHTDEAKNVLISLSPDECCCFQSAPKVFAKNGSLKIEKQVSILSHLSSVEIAFVPQTVSVKSEFVTPFYLTDSFHNLTPGRAPPRL